jgi:hypothetical protein
MPLKTLLRSLRKLQRPLKAFWWQVTPSSRQRPPENHQPDSVDFRIRSDQVSHDDFRSIFLPICVADCQPSVDRMMRQAGQRLSADWSCLRKTVISRFTLHCRRFRQIFVRGYYGVEGWQGLPERVLVASGQGDEVD